MSNKKSIVPELRFPEFVKEKGWTEAKLNALCHSISSGKDKKSSDGIFDLYGSTGKIGTTVGASYNGDYLLVARVGANAGLITRAKGQFGVTDNTLVVNIRNVDQIEYIFYFLDNIGLNKLVFGSGQPLVTGKQLKDLVISLPTDSKEQQKIADCLSSLDALIAAHRDKLDALRAHKKGLMQNLFPQEGERVPRYRFEGFVGEWEIRSVEQSIDLISGIALKSKELTEDNSGTPILRGVNITEGQIRHSAEMDRFYQGDINTPKMDKYLIQENDIVIGMDGSKVGKNVALISEKDAGAILIQRVARIRAIDSDVKFLYHNFFSNTFRRYVDSVNTSSGIPHISSKQIRDFEIGFPPTIQEQQKIADCLTAVDELIAAQEDQINQLQEHKRGLMQGLFPKTNG